MSESDGRKIGDKIRHFWASHKEDMYLVLIIFLVALASFGLGRLSIQAEERGKLQIVYPERQSASAIDATRGGRYVASLSGSKYHLPTCPGAQRMKEENKIWFDTKEDAETAGYEPAANCDGI